MGTYGMNYGYFMIKSEHDLQEAWGQLSLYTSPSEWGTFGPPTSGPPTSGASVLRSI